MSTLLTLYHRLPYPFRVLMATGRGYQLRRWRYGPETDRLVAEAIERESWSPRRWESWSREQLGRVLHRAATRVPYYRALWAERRARGDRRSWDDLANWPILDKNEVRRAPERFLADDCRADRMFHEHTSGTSGTPLDLWWSRETVRAWYAIFEARYRLWHGVSRHDRWAILGGQLVAPVAQRRPPFWVWNAALNQLYLSSYHLAPAFIPAYLDALERHRIRYLWGYSSSLYELARGALQSGRTRPTFAVALTNAEPLFDYQRRTIEEAFDCPVRETYGLAEVVAAAGECPSGRLHLWPDVGYCEIETPGGETATTGRGPLIATHLINPDMPLIRYRVGDEIDLGHGSQHAAPCPCGRSLPVIQGIEGRVDDTLYTADGRPIGRLDPVFKANLPIEEAQIIQEALDRIRVLVVPGDGYDQTAGESIAERLRDRLGPIDVTIETTDRIPRNANGKFRAVVCRIAPAAPRNVSTQTCS